MNEQKTRIRKWINKALYSPLFITIIFFVINALIFIVQKILSVDLTVYEKFLKSIDYFFLRIGNLIINNNKDNIFYRIINMVSVVLVSGMSIYLLKKIYRKFREFIRGIDDRAILGVNIILITLYSLYTVSIIINVFNTINILYGFCQNIIGFLSKLLSIDSIESSPGNVFGFNLIVRFALVIFAMYFITKVKNIWYYFFVEKVVVEDDKIKVVSQQDRKGHLRFIRFFYDEASNKLLISNIVTAATIMAGLGLMGAVGISDELKNGQILNSCIDLLTKILQVSSIDKTPLSQPEPISTTINTVFRIITGGVYLLSAVIAMYIIWVFLRAGQGKKVGRHIKIICISVSLIAVVLLVAYLIANNIESLEKPVTTILKIVIPLLIAVFVIKWVLVQIYTASYKKVVTHCLAIIKKYVEFFVEKMKRIIRSTCGPLYKDLTKTKKNHKILYAAAKFCAIASLLTTFLGLISFFKGTILTLNIFVSIISIVICFCITAGVQYAMLNIGMIIGKYIGIIFEKNNNILKSKIADADKWYIKIYKWIKESFQCTPERLKRIVIVLVLFATYLVPMTVSSLFSFASIFSGMSWLGGYRDTVNKNVWNKALSQSKQIMEKVVEDYNSGNIAIMKKADNVFEKYTEYYNAISAWNNKHSGKSILSYQTDGHTLEFKNKTKGMKNYKNAINTVLMEDRYDDFNITAKEQSAYYGNTMLYKINGYSLNGPIFMELSPMEPETSHNENTKITYGKATEKTASYNKYQLVDALVSEYIALMHDTKYSYDAAKDIQNDVINVENGEELGEFKEAYYEKIKVVKRIFEIYVKIRNNIVSDPKSTISADEFMSVNQLPAAVIEYAQFFSAKQQSKIDSTNNTSPAPEVDAEEKKSSDGETGNVDDTIQTRIINIDQEEKKETDFDTRIGRLISMLSYLPEISFSNDDNKDQNAKTTSQIVMNINQYYNYANSRNVDLAFGLDVAYKGYDCNLPQIAIARKILRIRDSISRETGENNNMNLINPYKDDINDVYSHSTAVIIVLIIAFLIDLMPIFIGIFMKAKKAYDKAHEKNLGTRSK